LVFLWRGGGCGTTTLLPPPPVYERHRLAVRTEPLLLARGKLEKLPMAGGALNVYVRWLQPLAPPGAAGADVVPLPDRTEPEAVPAAAEEVPADAALAEFRGVAPAVQSFAAGRRR
jgi:error-prone DNA polymerase